jgi:hypothetical protein
MLETFYHRTTFLTAELTLNTIVVIPVVVVGTSSVTVTPATVKTAMRWRTTSSLRRKIHRRELLAT